MTECLICNCIQFLFLKARNRVSLLLVFILLLGACQSNQEDPNLDYNQEIMIQTIDEENFILYGSKEYSASDTSDFAVTVSDNKGKVYIGLDLSLSLSFETQIEELRFILPIAEKDFVLDTIRSLTIPFFSYHRELTFEISQIPAIKNHLDYCYANDIQIVDYDLLEKEILKSSFIQHLITSLEKYNFQPSTVSLEKCHPFKVDITEIDSWKEEQSLIGLWCANISIY